MRTIRSQSLLERCWCVSKLAVLSATFSIVIACGPAKTSDAAGGAAPSTTVAKPATTATDKPVTLSSVFPPGNAKEMVLNTCGSCHPVVCVARGQRTAARWDSLEKDHKDKLTSTSAADLDAMFSYLKANFNDAKPEPQIPAELAQQSCTPF